MATPKKVSERRLVDVLVSYFKNTGRLSREMPVYEKNIDLVVLMEPDGELWAIEAKVTDWRRALKQATVNLIAADKSFIAIDARFVHRVDWPSLEARGIGLIAVGSRWGDVEFVGEAQTNNLKNRLLHARITDAVRGKRVA